MKYPRRKVKGFTYNPLIGTADTSGATPENFHFMLPAPRVIEM